MQDREIKFWEKQVNQNLLIPSIRAHRERAIRFFGAEAVLTENERVLFSTLEAHKIVNTSEDDLLQDMNQIHVDAIEGLEDLSSAEMKKVKKAVLLTKKDISALVRTAHLHLQNVLGKPKP